MNTMIRSAYMSVFILLLTALSTSCKKDKPDIEKNEYDWFEAAYIDESIEILVKVLQESGISIPDYESDGSSSGGRADIDDILMAKNYIDWKGAVTDRDEMLEALYDDDMDHWHATAEERIRHENEIGTQDLAILQLVILLDDKGNIIPNRTWRSNHPNFCKDGGMVFRKPDKRVVLTIYDDPEVKEVYIKAVNEKTNHIMRGSVFWARPNMSDADWQHSGMSEAWEKLNGAMNIKDIANPCIKEEDEDPNMLIEYTIHFDSEIRNIAEGEEAMSRLKSVIELTESQGDTIFTGQAQFNYVDYFNTILQGQGCVLEPKGGAFEVRLEVSKNTANKDLNYTLYLKPVSEENIPSLRGICEELGMSITASIWWSGFVTSHGDKLTQPHGFIFNDWDKTTGETMVAKKKYTTTISEDGGALKENTTFEIHMTEVIDIE